tara:strand:- start:3701 stop:3934 length:234 start_codon:yes stop_codon:yes gene_type:complete
MISPRTIKNKFHLSDIKILKLLFIEKKDAIKRKIAEIAGAEGIKKIPKRNILFEIIELCKINIKKRFLQDSNLRPTA